MRAFSTIGAMASIIGIARASAPSMGPGPLEEEMQARAPSHVRAALARLNDAIEHRLEIERDQLALWLPVALGVGITAWLVLPDPMMWQAFLLCGGGVAFGAFALPGGGRAARAIGIFALTAAIGCGLIWWRAERVAAPRLARTTVATFTARVERVEPQPARDLVRVMLVPDAASGLPPRIRVNVATADVPPGLDVGARLALRARLLPPAPAAVPGAYDFARAAWFQGIGATGRALPGIRLIAPGHPGGFDDWLARQRAILSAYIQRRMPGPPGGIATAFATGDQGALPDADASAMRRSGLTHLLSVSGLHVTAVVAATMLIVMRLLALSPRAALAVPLPLVAAGAAAFAGIAYTLLTGAEVPTIRSCIAALLVLAGTAIGREALTLRLVATGALFVLLIWPEALAGPSFQLSFAAVTSIVSLSEHPRARALLGTQEGGWARRTGLHLLGILATGIVVELALTPIALFHFHKSGVYGAVANIIAIPLTTFVIMPLEAAALLLDLAGIGAPFWWLAGVATSGLLGLAHLVSAMPGALRALPSMPAGAYAAMVVGGLWIALWRSRLRRAGAVPLVLGAAWALMTPPPDILVTGDGRHVAVRTADGSLALLRPRAGAYVRDMLGETAGVEAEAGDLDTTPGARCGPDLCSAAVRRTDRSWRLLATRSVYRIDVEAMRQACAGADIVVSERRLPRTCQPRWFKADPILLRRTGGIAIRLDRGEIRHVLRDGDRHPWIAPPSMMLRPQQAYRSGAVSRRRVAPSSRRQEQGSTPHQ